MSGWRVLINGAASVLGVLAFLTLVAHEVERVEKNLKRWDAREREALERRKMQVAESSSSTGQDSA